MEIDKELIKLLPKLKKVSTETTKFCRGGTIECSECFMNCTFIDEYTHEKYNVCTDDTLFKLIDCIEQIKEQLR